MWSSIKRNHGLKQSVQELHTRSRKHYVQAIRTLSEFSAIPGVIPLIRDIRSHNIPTAVASSSPPEKISHILNALGIRDQFLVVIDGDQIKNSKPAPDIFLEAAARIGKPPESCLVIEDSRAGVLAARAAGMICVGYKNTNSGSQDLSAADITIESFEALQFENLKQIHAEALSRRNPQNV